MEDYLFFFISNPIAAMLIHIVKKYTFTVLVSLIFSVYIYYKQKKVGIVIIISSFIILATLIIFKTTNKMLGTLAHQAYQFGFLSLQSTFSSYHPISEWPGWQLSLLAG